MKSKSVLVFLFFFVFDHYTFAKKDINSLDRKKITHASVGIGIGLYMTNLYIDDIWWGEQKTDFSFDGGRDAIYALNVDKCGHFMGGLIFSDIITSSIYSSGINRSSSYLIGGLSGTVLQLAIELKDAYSPYWGFSSIDLIAGTAGSFWPVLQHYNEDFRAVNFKFSYWNRSSHHKELQIQQHAETNDWNWHDNYINQTYWASIDIDYFIDSEFWPPWLELAFGIGIDDTQYLDEHNRKRGGNNEFYIALDYNIPAMLRKWEHPVYKSIKKWINYFHFPAPTIRISPKVEWYPLFL